MGRYVVNRDGGSFTNEGMLRFLDTLFRYGVAQGWTVTQRQSGANMSVDVAAGAGDFKVSGSYPVFAYSDALENVTVTASSPANARRDLVVAYVDLSVVDDTNNSGALKFMVVAGTPATSPVDPTAQTMQTAVGAGNPYQVIARVRVATGATTITTSVIDDLRTPMAPSTGYLWGGSSNTRGHAVPNLADSQLAIARKGVDVNGWTMYDNGLWKEWRRSLVSNNLSGIPNGGNGLLFSDVPLPVGVANQAAVHLALNCRAGGYAYAVQASLEGSDTDTTLKATVKLDGVSGATIGTVNCYLTLVDR